MLVSPEIANSKKELDRALERLKSLPPGFTDWILEMPDYEGEEIIGLK
jgi:hypothetical protein